MATNILPIQTTQKTYLQFSEEALNPELEAYYAKESAMNRGIAVATVVVLSVLVGTVIVLTAIYAPIFLPLCLICSVLALNVAKRIYDYYNKNAELTLDLAIQLATIRKNFKEIEDYSPEQIQQLLLRKKIDCVFRMQYNDPSLGILKPLIARHIFWENHVANLQTQQQDYLNQATDLEIKDSQGNREMIIELRNAALEVEKDALESKVKNAFINAVIRRFAFTGSLDDLGTFSTLGGAERAIKLQKNSNGASDFFTFKNGTTYTIMYNEAKGLDVQTLGTRIMTAMTA